MDLNIRKKSGRSNTNCCVENCINSYLNTNNEVRFFSFPKRWFDEGQREAWIEAIRRNRTQDKQWSPSPNSRICSEHFVNNRTSKDIKSPSFSPSIFPNVRVKRRRKKQNAQKYKTIRKATKTHDSETITESDDEKNEAQNSDMDCQYKFDFTSFIENDKILMEEPIPKKRKYEKIISCCVQFCYNNSSNASGDVQFFSFPNKWYEVERKKKWISRVRQLSGDANTWQPHYMDRVCSDHFINHETSGDPKHPGYLPTIFPPIYDNLPISDEFSVIKRDFGCQVYIDYVCKSRKLNFESNFHNDGVSTQVNFSKNFNFKNSSMRKDVIQNEIGIQVGESAISNKNRNIKLFLSSWRDKNKDKIADAMENSCRICLQQFKARGDGIWLYERQNGLTYVEKIFKFYNLTITFDFNISEKICNLCQEKLDNVQNFYSTLRQSEYVIKQCSEMPESDFEDSLKYSKKNQFKSINVENQNDIEITKGNSFKNSPEDDIDANHTEYTSISIENEYESDSDFFADDFDLQFFKTMHTTVPNPKIRPEAYCCDVCGEIFPKEREFRVHRTRHFPDIAEKCKFCDKTFRVVEYLRKHMSGVHGERNFLCSFCDKRYTNRFRLRRHEKQHLEPLQECHICKKLFQKHYLEKHLSTHGTERNVRCEDCDRTFSEMRALKRHYQSLIHQEAIKRKENDITVTLEITAQGENCIKSYQ